MLDITFEETRAYRDIREEAIREGRQEEAAGLLNRILSKRFDAFSQSERETVEGRSLTALEELGDSFLDFANFDELKNWLTEKTKDHS